MNRTPFLAALLVVAAAASPALARAPYGLASSAKMTHDEGESWTYIKSGLNLRAFKSVAVDPVALYSGSDAEFGKLSPEDRRKFTQLLGEALKAEVGRSVPVAARSGKGILRLKVTLLGVKKTTGGVATATRVTPMGLASSAAKSVTGRSGTLTGSVLVAVELFDGAGVVQAAAIRRRAPDALDIKATLSTSDTVKAAGRGLGKEIGQNLARRMGLKK